MSDRATITIQVGNTDDKLSQLKWSQLIGFVRFEINRAIHASGIGQVHFFGCSHGDEHWQNACWVVEIGKHGADDLRYQIVRVAEEFKQDAIAWTQGETCMLGKKPKEK